jgi:hypothetical protein
MISIDDDANFHKTGSEIDWRESYYCNFLDQDSDLCGVAWQGARPNQGHGECVFVLCDGEKDLIRYVNTDVAIPRTDDPARKMGSQEFVCVEPWRRWDINFNQGDTKVHVAWSQLTDVCNWDWESFTNSKRYECTGRIEASGVVAGRRFAFKGYGERDRAWGARNYGPMQYALNMAAQFPDDVAVHSFVMRDGDGKYRLFGFIHRDNKTCGLKNLEVTVKYAGDRGPPCGGSYILTDDLGRRVEIDSFSIINHVGFGVPDQDGSHISSDLSKSRSLMFLTWQRYTRRDGVRGRGYMDLNNWVGTAPSSVQAGGPLYSTLYSYGR